MNTSASLQLTAILKMSLPKGKNRRSTHIFPMNTSMKNSSGKLFYALLAFASCFCASSSWAANTNNNIVAGAADLGITTTATYTTANPTTTTDITFAAATTYANAGSLLLNNATLSVGTLNDLNATAITINGNKLLTLNTAANSVSGTAADLLYVASGGNLTINDSAGISFVPTGSVHNLGTLNLGTTPLTIAATKTLSFTGVGATTVGGNIATTTGAVTVNNAGGSVTLSGNNTYSGNTTLTAGQLNINSNTAIGTGTLALTSGIIDNTSGSDVGLTTANAISVISSITFGFGGTGNLNLGAGTISAPGNVIAYLMGTSGKTLTVGNLSNTLSGSGDSNGFYAMPGSNSTVSIGTYNIQTAGIAGVIYLKGNANIAVTGGIAPTVTGAGLVYNRAGTLTLSGTSTYTGLTTLNGGSFILDATGGTATLPSSNLFTLGGGNFTFKGYATGSTQTLGNMTLNAGASSLGVVGGTSGTTTLALGTMTDTTNNAMLNIVLSGTGPSVTTTTTNTNGIFGTRGAITVTVGTTTEFAMSGASGTNPITQYTTQTPFTGTTTGTVTNYSVTGSQVLSTVASTPNSVKIVANADSQSLNLGANTMKITSGGILFTGSNTGYEIKGTNAAALSSATNASAADLIIHNFGTGGLKISAVIANGGTGAQTLSLDGPGVTTLSGVNTYTGVTYVGGGAVLSIGANDGLGLKTTGAGLYLNKATLQATGTFALDNSGASSRPLYLGADGGTFDVTGNNTLTVSGVITNTSSSNTGSLTKTGTGTLLLSAADTYTGGFTYIQNGTLQIGGASGAIDTKNIVVIGSGTNSGKLVLGDASNTRNVTVAGLTTQGSGSSNAVVGANASNSTLTYTGNAAVPTTYSGSLGGNGSNENNLDLTVTAGQLTLTGASTFTGKTLVSLSGGVLVLGNNLALQNSAIDTSGAGTITLTGSTTPTFGGLVDGTGQHALASVITSGYSAVTGITLNPGIGVSNTYSGVIANGASGMTLTKTGAGTQTLSGANTYTGATTVSTGTLLLSAGDINSSSGIRGHIHEQLGRGIHQEPDAGRRGSCERFGSLHPKFADHYGQSDCLHDGCTRRDIPGERRQPRADAFRDRGRELYAVLGFRDNRRVHLDDSRRRSVDTRHSRELQRLCRREILHVHQLERAAERGSRAGHLGVARLQPDNGDGLPSAFIPRAVICWGQCHPLRHPRSGKA